MFLILIELLSSEEAGLCSGCRGALWTEAQLKLIVLKNNLYSVIC